MVDRTSTSYYNGQRSVSILGRILEPWRHQITTQPTGAQPPYEPAPFQRVGSTAPRRAILILLLLLGTYLLLPKFAGLSDAVHAARRAQPGWLFVAFLLQVLAIAGTAQVVAAALPSFGQAPSFFYVLQVTMASNFATMFIPSAGLSGLAVRVHYLREKGVHVEATLLSYILEIIGQGIAIAVLVVIATVQFALVGEVAPWGILLLLVGAVLAGLGVLSVLLSDPRPGDWRYALLDRVNKALVHQGRLNVASNELSTRLDRVRQAVHGLDAPHRWRVMVANLVRTGADILSLACTLTAFGYTLPLRLHTLNYGLSSLLGYLSSSPGGLLVAEGSLSALLARQGVPASTAVAAVLTYRLLSFWLPRAYGLVSWVLLQRQTHRALW